MHPEVRLIQPDNRHDMELSNGAAPRPVRYMGDKGDWWPFTNATTNVTAELSDKLAPMPNFNSYAKLGQRSGLKLGNFSPSGPLMNFDFELAPAPTVAPTVAPGVPLSDAPTSGTKAPGFLVPLIAVLVVGVFVGGYVAAKKFAPKQVEQQLSASNPQRKRVDVEQPHA